MFTPEDNPAGRIIRCFGGITSCARALAKPKSTVQRWRDSGFIHPDYYPEILAAAVAERVVLDAGDFNPVDVKHPAFNAVSIPSLDNSSARDARSSAIGRTAADAAPASEVVA